MKKVRFLGLALAAAMALTGAGYAYWNDSVTIGGTVTTGTLVTVFNKADTEGNFNFVNDNISRNNVHVATAVVSLNAENDTATIKIENLYPGAKINKELVIDNTGSIPVKLDTLTFAPTSNYIPAGAIKISADLNVPGLGTLRILDALNPDDINQVLAKAKDYDIEKGNKVEIDITIEVPTEVNNNTNGESKSLEFTVTPTFLQFNE